MYAQKYSSARALNRIHQLEQQLCDNNFHPVEYTVKNIYSYIIVSSQLGQSLNRLPKQSIEVQY